MHAGTRRAVLSYWQLAVGTATRGQAMGTLRHISQESGSQQGKAFYNQFERALSNLSYAANLAIFEFRLASHPPNNCLIVQKLTCGGILVRSNCATLRVRGDTQARLILPLVNLVKHHRRIAWPSLGGATR